MISNHTVGHGQALLQGWHDKTEMAELFSAIKPIEKSVHRFINRKIICGFPVIFWSREAGCPARPKSLRPSRTWHSARE